MPMIFLLTGNKLSFNLNIAEYGLEAKEVNRSISMD